MSEALIHTYHRAWATADLETLVTTLTHDFVTYDLVTGEPRDRDWELANCHTWCEQFPDSETCVEQIILSGDRAAVYWTLTATHVNDFMGSEPTGALLVIPGMATHLLRDGKIAETWRLSDTWSLMIQIGLVG